MLWKMKKRRVSSKAKQKIKNFKTLKKKINISIKAFN